MDWICHVTGICNNNLKKIEPNKCQWYMANTKHTVIKWRALRLWRYFHLFINLFNGHLTSTCSDMRINFQHKLYVQHPLGMRYRHAWKGYQWSSYEAKPVLLRAQTRYLSPICFGQEKRFNNISKTPKGIQFLADRTNGRAYATVLRLSSVCDVMYCG